MKITKFDFICDESEVSIHLGEDSIDLYPGDLTLTIAVFPDHILNNIKNTMITSLDEIIARPVLSPSDSQYYKNLQINKTIISSFYNRIDTEIDTLYKYFNKNIIYPLIVFVFPMAQLLVEYSDHYKFQFQEDKTPPHGSRTFLQTFFNYLSEQFISFLDPKHSQASPNELAFRNAEKLADQLFHAPDHTYFPKTTYENDGYCLAIEKYINKVIDGCNEISKLRQFASRLISTGSTLDDICDEFPWLNKKLSIMDMSHSIPSIEDMVISEIEVLGRKNCYIRKCASCGRFFFSNDATAKYCNFPILALGCMTCEEIHSDWDAKVNEQYENNKKNYATWIRRNTEQSDKFQKLDESLKKKIIIEINTIYGNWFQHANKVKDDYFLGKIDGKTAIEMLKIPKSKEERSPTLYKRFH